jgi:hypothetical protein
MFLSAISLMASKTMVSGGTDQISDPLWCNNALTVPLDFIGLMLLSASFGHDSSK